MTTPIDEEDFPRPLALDDPVLVRVVDRVLEPLKKKFSSKMLQALRKEALLEFSANPTAIALVRNIKRPQMAESGDVLVTTLPDEEPMQSSGSGTKGTPS